MTVGPLDPADPNPTPIPDDPNEPIPVADPPREPAEFQLTPEDGIVENGDVTAPEGRGKPGLAPRVDVRSRAVDAGFGLTTLAADAEEEEEDV